MSDAPPIGSGWLEGQRRAVTVLVVLALLSLVLVVMARGGASVITYTMLGGLHPPLVLDAGELLLTGLLALVLSPSLKPAVPRAWGRTAIGATVWLGFEAAVVGLTHLWVPTASGFEAILLFVVLGVVAEEWLFRGAVYGAAVAALGERPVGRLQLPLAVWISAACFSAAHLSYHGFRFDGPAVSQLAYTFPLGIVLGAARYRTHSLRAPTAIHVATNVLAVVLR